MPRKKAARRAAPRKPATPARTPGGRPAPSVVAGRIAPTPGGITVLSEPPHAHVVCRVCGRIADVPLDTHDELVLEQMAGRRPEGWSVELIAFSLTGACARCREGPAAPR
ncbi:MAG TPA: hypothetical protein VN864_01350 [Thermoplasmata archaeon]|nr:hypothetical protein [Thermoplasmata archaeon]